MAPTKKASRKSTTKPKSTGTRSESHRASIVLPTTATPKKRGVKAKPVKVNIDLDIKKRSGRKSVTPKVARKPKRVTIASTNPASRIAANSPLNYDGPMTRSRAKELKVTLLTYDYEYERQMNRKLNGASSRKKSVRSRRTVF